MQLVMAATTTAPSPTAHRGAVGQGGGAGPSAPGRGRCGRWRPAPARVTRSWGRAGPAMLGTTVDRSSSMVSENTGSTSPRVEQALLVGVGLDQVHMAVVTAGEAEVVEGDLVDGEDGAGGAVLGRHVADGGPVGQRHGGHPGTVELDELAHHPVLAQEMGDGQDQVGGGGARGLLAGEPEPHHRGEEHRQGLAEHGGLGLDAAHAPAQDAEPVDHGGVGVGADQGVAVGPSRRRWRTPPATGTRG